MNHTYQIELHTSEDTSSSAQQYDVFDPVLRKNPLVTALPDLSNAEYVINKIEASNALEPLGEYASAIDKESYFRKLVNNYYFVTHAFFDLLHRILSMLRDGYQGKKIYQHPYQIGEHSAPQYRLFLSTPKSGMSCALTKSLSLIPQVVEHGNQYQVVYLRVSAKGVHRLADLARSLLRQLARSMSSSQVETAMSVTGEKRILDFLRSSLSKFNVGLIIVEDVHSIEKRQERIAVLKDLIGITSEYRVPLIMTAAPSLVSSLPEFFKSEALFSYTTWNMLSLERDSIGRLTAKSQAEWLAFVEGLWSNSPLNEAFSENKALLLFELTQGIVGFTVLIFVESHSLAFRTKKAQISEQMMIEVSRKNLAPYKQLVRALKGNRLEELSGFEDFVDIELEERLIEAKKIVAHKKKENDFKGPRLNEKKVLFQTCIQLEIAQKAAKKLVERIFSENPEMPFDELLKLILEWEEVKSGGRLTNVKGPNTNRSKTISSEQKSKLDDLINEDWVQPLQLLPSQNRD